VAVWYIFSQFGMLGPRKIWQPWLHLSSQSTDYLSEALE
jgi:hypothetical protein